MSDTTILYVNKIEQETADSITIHFSQPEKQFNYLSGQFLTLIAEIDGKEERRAYSICSSSYIDKDISVTVKRVKGGKMSNHLYDNLKAGDTMIVLPPMGNFNLKPANIPDHVVLIACGSGITPLFSMVKTVLLAHPTSMVSLVYVNANKNSTIFYDQLQEWASEYPSRFHIVHYWGDEMKVNQPKTGFFARLFKKKNIHRINTTHLKTIFNELQITKETSSLFYLCGPQGLMDMATKTIIETGFSKEMILKESFYTVTKGKPTSEQHQIKILFKGKEHEVNVPSGKSILFAAFESGIDLPYSCQSGNCISCAGKCISGNVEMLTTDGLTEKQIKDGYVLTCVGYPKSDDVVIEFK